MMGQRGAKPANQVQQSFRRIDVSIVGDACVGKSSIAERYVNDVYTEEHEFQTFAEYKTLPDFHKTKLHIWEFPRHYWLVNKVLHGHLLNMRVILLVYDVNDERTLDSIKGIMLKDVEDHTVPDAIKILVGNKIDIDTTIERRVQREDVEEWSREKGLLHFETSAKHKIGIDECFQQVVQMALERDFDRRLHSSGIPLLLQDDSVDDSIWPLVLERLCNDPDLLFFLLCENALLLHHAGTAGDGGSGV